MLPLTLLADRGAWPRVLRFWVIAWIGNLVGAWLFGNIVGAVALVAIPFWYAFARQDRGTAG